MALGAGRLAGKLILSRTAIFVAAGAACVRLRSSRKYCDSVNLKNLSA
jgi:hypothetical protein